MAVVSVCSVATNNIGQSQIIYVSTMIPLIWDTNRGNYIDIPAGYYGISNLYVKFFYVKLIALRKKLVR